MYFKYYALGAVLYSVVLCGTVKYCTVPLTPAADETASAKTDVPYANAAGILNEGYIREAAIELLNGDAAGEAASPLPADITPPIISGVQNKTVTAGGTVSYRGGVTVSDDTDPAPSLSIDSGRVNLNEPGTYSVLYAAADFSGNRTTTEAAITVISAQMAEVNTIADEILADIINEGMTQREKAHAVFTYVAGKVKYQSGNSPRGLAEAAYICFTRGVGDCYVYCAGSQVLLERAGIPFHEVTRYQGKTEHFWLVVNTGDGWYHFDASANAVIGREERFMFTDTQAKEYTARIGNGRRYYEYDAATVPDVTD